MDHGIYISQDQVVHLSGGPLLDTADCVVCSSTLDEFAPGGWNSWVGVVDYRGHPHFSYLEVVRRAKSQLGTHGYQLGDTKSEHFALWCATGEVTDQAGQARRLAAVATMGTPVPMGVAGGAGR